MECAADGHKGRRRRGGLKTRETRERGRKIRATRVEGDVGRPGVKFLPIRKGGGTFLSRLHPLRLIRKASHDTSDLFPPFLGIILYIQRTSSFLSLSLLSAHIADFSYHRRRSRDSRPMKSSTDTSKSPRSIRGFAMGEKKFRDLLT